MSVYLCISQACTDTEGTTCNICLSQTDFEGGTYRIISSGLYCLTESISFNPIPGNINSPNTFGAWHPTNPKQFPGCSTASDGAFALGFFAAISIETSDVTIDLNNHIIEMDYTFYLQQRFYSHIEIGPQPFLPNFGPADFGSQFINVKNIEIRNGELGLTSHHGIHSNNPTNVAIHHLKIYDFEVAGIQLNGFHGATLTDLRIGPSLHNVPLTGYYSNARFLLLALRQLLSAIKKKRLPIPRVSFAYLANDEALSLADILSNLVEAMDVVFRDALHVVQPSEKESSVYAQAMALFSNRKELPDGSSIYGIVLNSFSVAVGGFGDATSRIQDKVRLNNINIKDLRLAVNEIPAIYFDTCDNGLSVLRQVLKGPFGDVMDIRMMIDSRLVPLVDNFDLNKNDLSELQYVGNVVSDAQIALYLYGKDYVGDGVNYAFGSYMSEAFLEWAVNDVPLPSCARFVCNGDIMHHTNKGIIGLRVDGMSDVSIGNVGIRRLENESPLASNACADYSGPLDGGIGGTRQGEGGMNTDVRGISIANSGVFVGGGNEVSNLDSYYGDVTAIDLMGDSFLHFKRNNIVKLGRLKAASKLNKNVAEYNILVAAHKTPYPNNFGLCTIKIQDTSIVVGNVPPHLKDTHCVDPFA
eukprot:56020_1